MKNTRLYFDKQFTPIIQAELYINFLGELTPNISNDLVPILSPISYSIGNQNVGYGVSSTEYDLYSASMQQLLDSPYIFKLSHFTTSCNACELQKDSDDYGDFIYTSLGIPHGDISVFNEGVDSGDITSTFQVTNIVAEDSEGSSVTLDNFDFIRTHTKFPTNIPNIVTDIPLAPRFYINDSAIHYPQGFKWVKFTVTANAGFKIKEGSKYSKYYSVAAGAELGEKQYVFYVINPDYKVPGVFIQTDDYSGQYNSTTLDYVTNVNHANLTSNYDGTWTLDFSYDFDNGAGVTMSGVSNTITNIPDASVTEGSTIYTDTTVSTSPVPFIIILRA